MKKAILTILIFGLLATQSCSNRSDKLFSGFDELHYIILFEKGNDFELLYNGVNTATGQFLINGDTIFLTYSENQFDNFDPNQELTRKILIDKESNRVTAIDDRKQFCANIEIDNRKIKN